MGGPDAGPREHVLGLDMLRGLAIGLVLVAHFTNNVCFWYGVRPPFRLILLGTTGVDLFFALSGFLIGGILLDIAARAPTWHSLRVFLVRRWMRTLPAYLTWLLVLAVLFPPPAHLGGRVLHFALLVQNLAWPMPADDWFAVSWSLSIEEWFYLLFGSAAIATVAALRRQTAILVPLTAMLVVPLALRCTVPAYLDFATGFTKIVPFRLDEIGYGVALSWMSRRRTMIFERPSPSLLAGLFLVGSSVCWILPISFDAFLTVRDQLAAIGFALCIPAALRVRRAPHWLERAAQLVSRLSYCLYLVHLTVLVDVAQRLWLAHRVTATAALAIAVIGTVAAAELLSRCVERPFMRWRPPQYRVLSSVSAAAFGVAN